MKLIPWRDILILGLLAVSQVAGYCQETHSGTSGTIVSPFDVANPTYYPLKTSCTYTITTQAGRDNFGNTINLEFVHFDLEQSINCTKDVLEIVDKNGALVEKRCGNDKRPYVSQTGTIKLIFRSDTTIVRTGFRIRYRACGGYYRDAFTFSLISPSYGIAQYPNNTNCMHYLDSIDDFGFRLVFNEFSLENSAGCINDKFSVYKGYSTSNSDLIGRKCGKNKTEIISTSKVLTTTFVTNQQISDNGFSISVYACSRLLTTHSGYIMSPKFPLECEPGAFCIYEIRHNPGSKLKIEFQNFVQYGNDYLIIKNGSMSSNAISHNITNTVDVEREVYGNVIFLELSCDIRRSDQYHGFKLHFYDNQGSCSKYKPCKNNATCTDVNTKFGAYNCSCPLDYEGKNCSEKIIPCNSNPCLNNGQCTNIPSTNNQPPTYKCKCNGDYSGQQCESQLGACQKYNPCQNNGQCTDIDKAAYTYRCTCPLDYTGKNCTQKIIPCNSSPCLNGGTCTNVPSTSTIPPSYSCRCTEEFRGRSCEHFIDGCKEYTTNDKWQRSINYKDTISFCDSSLQFSWYRFISKAGPDMPTRCPEKNSCGTTGSIWINGTIDLDIGNESDVIACARNATDCCSASWDIRVKRCREVNGTSFNVYRLRMPPSCPMSYCAGTEVRCPLNWNSVTGFTPNCTEMYPKILEKPRFFPDVENNRLVFKCEVKTDTKEEVARFHVTWYEEFPLRQINQIDILKGTERIARLQNPLNSTYGTPLFRLGKRMFCKVYSWYEGRPYGKVNSPVQESNHYFAGVMVQPSKTQFSVKEDGPPLELTLKITVPVVCSVDRNCKVIVRLVQDNSEIFLSLCAIRYEKGNAVRSQVFKITAKTDFIYNSYKKTVIQFFFENLTEPVDFINHHKIPDIQISINDIISYYTCTSASDPYISTFGGGGYFQVSAGDYVLVKSTTRVFEVQARTYYCAAARSGVCNCGVAAREGNDVIIIDFCSGGQSAAWFASKREPAYGTKLYRISNGYSIIFPSGAQIHLSGSSITIYIPWKDYSTTIGGCHSAGGWFSQWGSLFNYQDNVQGCQTQTRKYYCICKKDSNGYQEDCSHRTLIGRENYYDGFSQMTLLLHPAVKACNTKVKEPSIVLPDITKRNETYTPLPPTGPPPTFPTITGKKKPVVRQYCENRIRNSAVGKACSIIPNFPFQNYIDICVQNVKLTDTYDFTLDVIMALQKECLDIMRKNETYRERDNNRTGIRLPKNITDTLCPGLCNDNGRCVEGVCICYTNFTSDDCSIDTNRGPIITEIRYDGICDIQSRDDCHLVRVLGSNLMQTNKSSCRTTKLRPAASNIVPTSDQVLHRFDLLSFAEVLCTMKEHPLQPHKKRTVSHVIYKVDLTTDGTRFSDNRLDYVIYDSKCMSCSNSLTLPAVCTIKVGMCSIGGICYSAGDPSPFSKHLICNPPLSQTNFTGDHFPRITRGPTISPFIKDKRLAFKCEFESDKNEESARFDVTWYEGSPLKKINQTDFLKGLERNATLQNQHEFNGTPLFLLGTTIICKVQSWFSNTSLGKVLGPFHESNHFFAGIKVEPRRQPHIISESGKPLKLTVTATVPIVCKHGDFCKVLVNLTTDGSEIFLNLCIIEFKPGPANQLHVIEIAAKRDFILDGNKMAKLQLELLRHIDPVDWDNHHKIEDVVIKVKDVDTRRCQSNGDPHFITYDKLYFDHYRVGTYLLTKSNCRDFEVHVRTHKCNAVSCNCGVAAREGNDVIVIDFCNENVQTARFASKGQPANGTRLMRDSTGKNFMIIFPSGSFVQFNIFPFAGTFYGNVGVQVPSDDFDCTIGLCGTFDHDINNELKDRFGKIHSKGNVIPAPTEFTESWSLMSDKSLFEYVDNGGKTLPKESFCSCESKASGESKVTCKSNKSERPTNYDQIDDWDELVSPNAITTGEGIRNKRVILPKNDQDVNYKYNPDQPSGIIPSFPTKSGRPEVEVKAYCSNAIRNSSAGRICSAIPDFPFDHYIKQCVKDIQITDTDDFTISAIHAMQFGCEEIFLKNTSYWRPHPDNNETTIPRTDFNETKCPGLCNGKGDCVKSKCKCKDEYTSADCSMIKKKQPIIKSVGTGSLCDKRHRSDCHRARVRGTDFLNSEKLACRATKVKISKKGFDVTSEKTTHKATLISFKEIICDISSKSVKAFNYGGKDDPATHSGYIIELTNDGMEYSKASDPYVIFDSKCMICDGKSATCTQKDKTCIISGNCYLHGETSADGNKCLEKGGNSGKRIGQLFDKQRNMAIIGVSCVVGVVLIIAIVSLISIRRKKIEDKAKAKIENDLEETMELGKIDISLFYSDDNLCQDGEEVNETDVNVAVSSEILLNNEYQGNEVAAVVQLKSEMAINEVNEDAEGEELAVVAENVPPEIDVVSSCQFGVMEEDESLVKEAEIVLQTNDAECAPEQAAISEVVDAMEEPCGKHPEAEGNSKEELAPSIGYTSVPDDDGNTDDTLCYANAAVNPSYEYNEACEESMAVYANMPVTAGNQETKANVTEEPFYANVDGLNFEQNERSQESLYTNLQGNDVHEETEANYAKEPCYANVCSLGHPDEDPGEVPSDQGFFPNGCSNLGYEDS